MDSASPYDLIRKRETAELTPAEMAQLEAALRSDPELEAFARAFSSVHDATQGLEVECLHERSSALALETIVGTRAAGSHGRRMTWAGVAAAALFVAALLVGTRGARDEAVIAPFHPQHIEVVVSDGQQQSASALFADLLPERLVAYRPAGPDGVHWLRDEGSARRVARIAGRPILRYESTAICPLCQYMESGPFKDPAVLSEMTGVVALGVRHTVRSAEQAGELMREGWPRLRVETADGQVIQAFHGLHDADGLARAVAAAVRAARSAPVDWADVERGLRLHLRVTQAAREDLPGRAWEALAGQDGGAASTPLAERAARARQWIRQEAHLALRAVTEAPDAQDARAALLRALRRFDGSPFADDFRALLVRLDEEGRLPRIEERQR